MLALLAVITGECWYGNLPEGWTRWSESFAAWVAAPGRWPWLAGQFKKKSQSELFIFDERFAGKAGRSLQTVAPAICLAVVFSVVFSRGNAVFGEMLSRAIDHLVQFLEDFDFSFNRLVFWLLSATFALAFTRPRLAQLTSRPWARKVETITRRDVPVAIWQSRFVLVVLNALFFLINTIDVFYLWRNAGLPRGVSYSQFVHEGVFSLIVAVLLSGLVITVIFQQASTVKRGRFLRACALLWVAQNLVLIAGVFLRLKLYVLAYQLSTQRVYVGCFLLLVVAGFILLAWHVARDGNINALVFRNAVATFILFYILQFANVNGWVADYNVTCWKHDPSRPLDIAYLNSLGPDAWPALVDAASPGTSYVETRTQARILLQDLAEKEVLHLADFDWRSWQARRDRQSRWLVQESRMLPPAPTNGADNQDGALPR